MADTSRVAVLIDCDNISAKAAPVIMAETARHGVLSVKRAYGDFTSSALAAWRPLLPQLAIQPIQQFPYSKGKNATDSALIIDAMDLLVGTEIDVFCIISSDSDFTRLAGRLRESGKRVYGIGRKTTPTAFRNACDRFTYLELLTGEPKDADAGGGPAQGTSQELPASVAKPGIADEGDDQQDDLPLPDLPSLLDAAVRASAKDDGWAPLATVGWYIVNNHPTFDARNYGYPKLGDLVRQLDNIKVETRKDATGTGHLWVTLAEQ